MARPNRGTAEVTAALRGAVAGAARLLRTRPEVPAYVATSAATVAAGAAENLSVQRYTKPLMAPALAVGVLRSTGLDTTDRALLLGGLAAATIGDVYLIDPDDDRRVLRGASAFAVMQICYSALLLRRGARPTPATALPQVAALVGAAGLLFARSRPVAAPLVGYGSLLGTTATLGLDPGFAPRARRGAGMPVPDGTPATGLAWGGRVFTLSDGMIVVRRTLLTGRRGRAAAEAVVLATYAAAQYLLVEGMRDTTVRA